MANTNFSSLTSEQLTIWSRDFWRVARNMSFINQFAGSGPNAMVQRISELTQSEKGARAVLTLLADMTGDGIVGDNTLEGNEEALRAYKLVTKLEKINPSLEPSHAFAEAIKIAPKLSKDTIVIINSCGDAKKDRDILKKRLRKIK